jgi:hypothetical protein
LLTFKLGGLNLRFRVLWQLVQVSSNPQLQPSFFVEQASKALFGLVEEAGIKGAQRLVPCPWTGLDVPLPRPVLFLGKRKAAIPGGFMIILAGEIQQALSWAI